MSTVPLSSFAEPAIAAAPRRLRRIAAVAALFTGLVAPVLPATAATAAPRSVAANVAIEPLARYETARICSPTAKPGATKLMRLLVTSYRGSRNMGISRGCGTPGKSEHKEGRAVDWGQRAWVGSEAANVQDFLNWALATDARGNRYANARRLGIMYMIWNDRIWTAAKAGRGWQRYTHSACRRVSLSRCGSTYRHRDHLHISLSWAGARGTTSYWGGPKVDGGNATPRPAGDSRDRWVVGDIRAKWLATGGSRGVLGWPTTAELPTPGNAGRYNHFEGGSVYWTPRHGAHVVRGSIRDAWARLRWEAGELGFPTSDEYAVSGGRQSDFERGSLRWNATTGAVTLVRTVNVQRAPALPAGQPVDTSRVIGSIRERWLQLGGASGVLGRPITGENSTPDGKGRYTHFERGSIYWSITTGAHEVYGSIRHAYAALDWEQGFLRYPTRGEHAISGGRAVMFQGGELRYNAATGRITSHRPV